MQKVLDSVINQCRAATESHAQRAASCVGAEVLLSRWGLFPVESMSGGKGEGKSRITKSVRDDAHFFEAKADDDAVLCAMVSKTTR